MSTGAGAAALRRGVRLRVVLKYVGQLWLVQAGLLGVQLAVALRFGERGIALRYAVMAAGLLVAGGLLGRLRASARVQPNEAMVIAALTFVAAPLALTYPFMGSGLGFVDALFEAVSAVTTTGLSTLPTVEGLPAPFLFARAFGQWYGGLGFVVLILALASQPGSLARRLAFSDNVEDDLVGGTKAHARSALVTYSGLTVIGAVLLWITGTDGFEALAYALASVSTGGFSPHDGSLGWLPGPGARAVLTLLSVAGAVSLVTHRQVLRQGMARFAADPQLLALVAFGLVFSALLSATLALVDGLDVGDAVGNGAMMALSAQSTTGFSSMSLATASALAKALLIVAMVIGGSAGSTAGGVKLLRVLILARVIHAAAVRSSLPHHAVYEPRLGPRRIGREETQDAVRVLALFAVVAFVSWLAFLAHRAPALDALFEVVSATGTVGLSTGLCGPELPTFLKLVLCVDMLMGRLEIMPLLVLAYPGTWSVGRRNEDADRVRGSE